MKSRLETLREDHLALAVREKAARLVRLYGGEREGCAVARMADAHACAVDPLYWIASWGVIRNEHASRAELFDTPFMLWPDQVLLFRWIEERMDRGQLGLVVKSRELGVSWELLHLLYHGWRFRGWSSLVGSRIEDLVDRRGDLDSLFEKLRYIHRAQPPHLQERRVVDNQLLFHNLRAQTKIAGQRTTFDFGRGGRGRLVFVDEYPAIPPRIQEAIVRSTESYAPCRIFVGNPQGDRNYEYQLYKQLAAECVFEMPWTADPYRDEEWRRAKLIEGGGALTPEQFDREYGAKHTSIGTSSMIFRFREDILGYDETTAEWRKIRDAARATWFHAGGWDYGSGPSLLANVDCLVDYGADGARPELWFDAENIFQQTDWRTAGATVLESIRGFGGRCLHFGDPAGEQADSAQTSWASNLQGAGIPLVSLVAWYNSKDGKEWAIKTAQAMIDEDRIHVHRAKCPVLFESLGKWRRDVQDWIDMSLLSRTYIAPRKDRYSHLCEAFLYAVAGVMFYASQASGGATEHELPARVQDSMSAVFSAVRRGR